jgi:hypothetical protein
MGIDAHHACFHGRLSCCCSLRLICLKPLLLRLQLPLCHDSTETLDGGGHHDGAHTPRAFAARRLAALRNLDSDDAGDTRIRDVVPRQSNLR